MIKKDTIVAYSNGEIQPTEIANRLEKRLGTNCHSVELMSFIENWKIIRVIVKKSRLGAENLEKVRDEYRKLRLHLSDLIPMQAFVTEKPKEEHWISDLVTAFCSPVTIAYDIFWSNENFEFLRRELANNPELQNDIDLFIRGYRALEKEWFYIDLFGDENLIVTREWRLKYIDSFIIDMAGRKSLRSISEDRFKKLATLGKITENSPIQ